MLRSISRRVRGFSDYPARAEQLNLFKSVLDGTLYDVLRYDFHEEYTEGGEYIPVRDRAPSVRYALCRTVVEDSVSLLFSEGHFPTIECEDEATRDGLAAIGRESGLNAIMVDAAIRGSIGSVAIFLRVLKERLFFEVADTLYLMPEWDAEAPDTLVRVTERYKVRGDALRERGYDIADSDLGAEHWFQRTWDAQEETWFVPWLVSQAREDGRPVMPKRDARNSVAHRLGFVPVVWIRNLPGGNGIDGACSFKAAIETSIEIDYQLSQAGRGLKYSSEPTLLIKEPAAPADSRVHGAGNALVVSEKGDAKLLEIDGGASGAVIEYVRFLRELALEAVHGNRASPERMTAAQSGRALELMNQGLIWLADNLRVSYGTQGLLQLAKMIVVATGKYPVTVAGARIAPLNARATLSLRWSRWYPSSADDRQRDANTLKTLGEAGHMSRETAVRVMAENYDLQDVDAELARIKQDEASADARAKEEQAQVQYREALPA